MKGRTLAQVLVTLLSVGAGEATAGDKIPSPDWYVGIGGGYSQLDPDTSGSVLSVDDGIDTGWRLFGGYHLTDAIAIEAEYASLGTVTFQPVGEMDYQVFSLSGLYYLIERDNNWSLGWSVYGRGGIAMIRNSANIPYEIDHAASIHYGVGAEWRINDDLGLRFDATTYDEDAAAATASIVYYVNEPAVPATPPVSLVFDTDGDGVNDTADMCPSTAAGVVVDIHGCEPDSYLDGIVDRRDQCPGTPQNTPVDRVGCMPDKDRDGIANKLDKCPDTPAGLKVDAIGCAKFQARISQVHFNSGSAQLDRNSRNILNDIARELKNLPHLSIEIQAHTDSDGDDVKNLKLSQRRAEAVLVYLLNRGVDVERLRAKGYGESRPIATNTTAEGRNINRRVELKSLN